MEKARNQPSAITANRPRGGGARGGVEAGRGRSRSGTGAESRRDEGGVGARAEAGGDESAALRCHLSPSSPTWSSG